VISFAALEIKQGESDHDVICRFFEVAEGMGLEFKALEPYGIFTLGQTRLLRFKTDCSALQRLIPFFQDENRAYACPGTSGYRYVTQTTEGQAPITLMQGQKLPGNTRRYRGTTDSYWKRQFK